MLRFSHLLICLTQWGASTVRVLLHRVQGLNYRELTDIHFSEYVFAFFTNKEARAYEKNTITEIFQYSE